MTERTRLMTEHFQVNSNWSPAAKGRPQELESGVYVSAKMRYSSNLARTPFEVWEGISTTEAREVGNALIALADEIEADQKRLPDEPEGYGTVIKFPEFVPAFMVRSDVWKFTNSDITYTWERLCALVDQGPGEPKFEILYWGK